MNGCVVDYVECEMNLFTIKYECKNIVKLKWVQQNWYVKHCHEAKFQLKQ